MLMKHPTLAHVTRQVPDRWVKGWLAQGWQPIKPIQKPIKHKPVASTETATTIKEEEENA